MCLERYKTILQFIKRNPGCTIMDIEAYFEFGVSHQTIDFEINSLHKNHEINIDHDNRVRRFYGV